MKIGNVEAAPGSIAFGLLHVAETPSGAPLGIPLQIVRGTRATPVLLVDSCIHGQEITGALAIKKLLRRLSPSALRGTLICVPCLNSPAFDAGTRVNLLEHDPKNLDHVFPGKERGTLAEMVAHVYYREVVKRADALLNFHTGGAYLGPLDCTILPPSTTPATDRKVVELARAVGLERIWNTFDGSPEYGGSLIEVAARDGLPAVTVEVGCHTAWFDHGEEFVDTSVRAIENVLKHLGMLEGSPQVPKQYLYTKGPLVSLHNRRGGIWEAFARIGDRMKAGQSIGRIVDTVRDAELEVVTAPFDGIVFDVRIWPLAYPGGLVGHFADGEVRT
jgi:predicted deacylase